MAAKKASESLSDTIIKFLSVRIRSKLVVQRSYDDWAWKQIWADRKKRMLIKHQRLDVDQHVKLGSDLAVSHFVIGALFGRVRDHRGTWITHRRDLPPDYSKAFKVTAIDASKTGLITEGVDNFVGLGHLESIDLSHNPALDDFACDQLSRQFRTSKTLSAIDLSYNPLVSVYGLEVLLRIPSLRNIIAIDTQASKLADIDLFTLAAEDERQCSVFVHSDGRQFNSQELEDIRLDISPIPRLKSD